MKWTKILSNYAEAETPIGNYQIYWCNYDKDYIVKLDDKYIDTKQDLESAKLSAKIHFTDIAIEILEFVGQAFSDEYKEILNNFIKTIK